jgi:hypothetical protein
MFQKGRKKTGGRAKGVPNRLNAEIRENLASTLLRYFGPRQMIETYSPDGTEVHTREDDFNIEHDMLWHNMTRLRLMLQMAKLVLPPPPKEEQSTTIHIDPLNPMQCGFIVPRNEPKVSIQDVNKFTQHPIKDNM